MPEDTNRTRSTGVRAEGEDWHVEGELTLKGITKPLTLELELRRRAGLGLHIVPAHR